MSLPENSSSMLRKLTPSTTFSTTVALVAVASGAIFMYSMNRLSDRSERDSFQATLTMDDLETQEDSLPILADECINLDEIEDFRKAGTNITRSLYLPIQNASFFAGEIVTAQIVIDDFKGIFTCLESVTRGSINGRDFRMIVIRTDYTCVVQESFTKVTVYLASGKQVGILFTAPTSLTLGTSPTTIKDGIEFNGSVGPNIPLVSASVGTKWSREHSHTTQTHRFQVSTGHGLINPQEGAASPKYVVARMVSDPKYEAGLPPGRFAFAVSGDEDLIITTTSAHVRRLRRVEKLQEMWGKKKEEQSTPILIPHGKEYTTPKAVICGVSSDLTQVESQLYPSQAHSL
ncbi:hypothetical protein M231_07897 [Tremella mesenterica]|uniref:Uncharacterized protein n=1 Tax=Tremella mesenterica TaxID=5217 RepID=A0A4Q1BFA8_TREME|nr:hypothetical protein M231_07897 [Tremella mesenterica]